MNSDPFLAGLAVLVVVGTLLCINNAENKCVAAGGSFVRGVSWFECVQKQEVK